MAFTSGLFDSLQKEKAVELMKVNVIAIIRFSLLLSQVNMFIVVVDKQRIRTQRDLLA